MKALSEGDDDKKYKVKRLLRKQLSLLIPNLLKPLNIKRPPPSSKLTSLDFTKNLLSGQSNTCYELMRMEKNGFIYLCQFFKVKIWLYPSKHVSVE